MTEIPETECDVCEKTCKDGLVCSKCFQAVYCGEECQAEDFMEHSLICTHVNELTPDEVKKEVAEYEAMGAVVTGNNPREWIQQQRQMELVNAGAVKQKVERFKGWRKGLRAKRFESKAAGARGQQNYHRKNAGMAPKKRTIL